MTIEQYMQALREMDDCIRLPKAKLADYVKATYNGNALLIKPSLYFRLVRKPWHLLCTPFNKALRWLGRNMPLYDVTGQPMNDNYIHLTAMLPMAGFIPFKEYGWHVVDAQPIAKIEPETFKKYFRSQCKATGQMPKDQAVEFLDILYSEYEKKQRK
jgi:hypothetical protein